MRFQTCIFLKDGSMRSGVVRAQNTSEALRIMMAANDVAYAPHGYAHPLRLPGPDEQHQREDLYCSVTGQLIMSSKNF